MIDSNEIKHLANLARIRVADDEVETLKGEIESIIGYVSDIQKAKDAADEKRTDAGNVTNVLREDTAPHEPGAYTEDLLDAAPQRTGDHLSVKKILSRE